MARVTVGVPTNNPLSLSQDRGRSQLLGVDIGREPRLAAATGSSVAVWRPAHADRGFSASEKEHMMKLALPDAPPLEDIPEWRTPRTAGMDGGSPGRVGPNAMCEGFQDRAAARHLNAHQHQMRWYKFRALRPAESRPASGGKGHFQYPGGTESMLAEKESRLGFTVPALDPRDRREGEYLVSRHSPTRHSFDTTASQSFRETRRLKTARKESLTNGPLWRSPGVNPLFEKSATVEYAAYIGPWVPAAKDHYTLCAGDARMAQARSDPQTWRDTRRHDPVGSPCLSPRLRVPNQPAPGRGVSLGQLDSNSGSFNQSSCCGSLTGPSLHAPRPAGERIGAFSITARAHERSVAHDAGTGKLQEKTRTSLARARAHTHTHTQRTRTVMHIP